MPGVVVVGAGPAGLAAAARLAEGGRQVRVVARGYGFTHWGAGAVDVLARVPGGGAVTGDPLAAVERLPERHPYRLLGAGTVAEGLAWFQGFTAGAGLPHAGEASANRRQVTALGTLRTTCLLPEPAAGALDGRVAVLGFGRYQDFPAALCARGLRRAGTDASAATVALPPSRHQRFVTSGELAAAVDDPVFRERLAPRLAAAAGGAEVAVVPAVLGLRSGHAAWAELERLSGLRLVEAATPPPSVPGLRLLDAYRRHLARLGVRWQLGFPAIGVVRDGDRVTALRCQSAAREVVIPCDEMVLATGGVAGHGVEAHRDGTLTEAVAGLPVAGFPDRSGFVAERFLDDHPLAAAGVRVDADLRPLGPDGAPLLANVRCAGGLLAGHDPSAEGSREGVALACAARLATVLARPPAPSLTTGRGRP